MPLKGGLKDFSLPDLFQLIHFGRKNGTLVITNGEAKGYVCFRNGNVFFATHNWKRAPLGQRLTQAGMVTQDQVDEALDLQKTTRKDQRLGNILVELGYLSRESLEVFVEEQISDAVFNLLRWSEGEFDFDPDEIFPEEDIGLSMSTEDLIMEGSRRMDEWFQIEKKVPSLNAVFKTVEAPRKDANELNLTSEERLILYHVDGESTVRDIIEKSGQSAIMTCKALYGLVTAGFVELAVTPVETEAGSAGLESEIGRIDEATLEMPTDIEAPSEDSELLDLDTIEEVTVVESGEDEVDAASENRRGRKRGLRSRKKQVDEEIISLDDGAEEVITVEALPGGGTEEPPTRTRLRRSKRKDRGQTAEREETVENNEPDLEVSADAVAGVDTEVVEEAVETPEPADNLAPSKDDAPAPGQSLVDYYKSLALRELADSEVFRETEERRHFIEHQEEVLGEGLDSMLESGPRPVEREVEEDREPPEDVPLEWAGHLTRMRGRGKTPVKGQTLTSLEAASIENIDDKDETTLELVDEPVADLKEMYKEAALDTEVEIETAEAADEDTFKADSSGFASEIEKLSEEPIAIDAPETEDVADEPVVDTLEVEEPKEFVFEEEPSVEEVPEEIEDIAGEIEEAPEDIFGGVFTETTTEKPELASERVPRVEAALGPVAEPEFETTAELELETTAEVVETSSGYSLEQEEPVEDSAAEEEIAVEEALETELASDELPFEDISPGEMLSTKVVDETIDFPLVEDVPVADDALPSEDEIERLLQVTPPERGDLSREELLAFDQPTYAIIEPREVAPVVSDPWEGDPIPSETVAEDVADPAGGGDTGNGSIDEIPAPESLVTDEGGASELAIEEPATFESLESGPGPDGDRMGRVIQFSKSTVESDVEMVLEHPEPVIKSLAIDQVSVAEDMQIPVLDMTVGNAATELDLDEPEVVYEAIDDIVYEEIPLVFDEEALPADAAIVSEEPDVEEEPTLEIVGLEERSADVIPLDSARAVSVAEELDVAGMPEVGQEPEETAATDESSSEAIETAVETESTIDEMATDLDANAEVETGDATEIEFNEPQAVVASEAEADTGIQVAEMLADVATVDLEMETTAETEAIEMSAEPVEAEALIEPDLDIVETLVEPEPTVAELIEPEPVVAEAKFEPEVDVAETIAEAETAEAPAESEPAVAEALVEPEPVVAEEAVETLEAESILDETAETTTEIFDEVAPTPAASQTAAELEMIEAQVEAEADEELLESAMELDVAGMPAGVTATSNAVAEEPEFASYNGPPDADAAFEDGMAASINVSAWDDPAPATDISAQVESPFVEPVVGQVDNLVHDGAETLREMGVLREPEPEPEPYIEAVETVEAVESKEISAEAAQFVSEEEDDGEGEDDGGILGTLRVSGKRGAGTSLVDLETFELEQELMELAGGVQQKKRIPISQRITQPGKKEKKGRGGKSRGKEVDKGSVKKIIYDLNQK